MIFFNGQSLKYILKDENLKITFLVLCSMCNYMIGSEVSAVQKGNLVKAIRKFNQVGD